MRQVEWKYLAPSTKIAKVFGGWVIRYEYSTWNNDREAGVATSSMVFVPDPEHKWMQKDLSW